MAFRIYLQNDTPTVSLYSGFWGRKKITQRQFMLKLDKDCLQLAASTDPRRPSWIYHYTVFGSLSNSICPFNYIFFPSHTYSSVFTASLCTPPHSNLTTPHKSQLLIFFTFPPHPHLSSAALTMSVFSSFLYRINL